MTLKNSDDSYPSNPLISLPRCRIFFELGGSAPFNHQIGPKHQIFKCILIHMYQIFICTQLHIGYLSISWIGSVDINWKSAEEESDQKTDQDDEGGPTDHS